MPTFGKGVVGLESYLDVVSTILDIRAISRENSSQFGIRLDRAGFRVPGSGLRVAGCGFRVRASEFWVQGWAKASMCRV